MRFFSRNSWYLCLMSFAFLFTTSFVFSPVIPSYLSSSFDKDTLRIVTYNIRYGTDSYGMIRLQDIVSFLDSLQADIICLQEVDMGALRSVFTNQPDYLKTQLRMEGVYGTRDKLLIGETGNMILSRFPIVSSENILLPSKEQPRTALVSVIQTPKGSFTVINTHLGLSKQIRFQQLDILLQIAEASSYPVLLAGDFNTPSLDEIQPLNKDFIDSAVGSTLIEVPTFRSTKYLSRIDYIFLPACRTAAYYEVSSFDSSDHYPVIVDMQ